MLALLVLAIPGCSRDSGSSEGPTRADDPLPVPSEFSLLSLPVELDAGILLRAVEEEVPRELWSIDRRFERCVPKKKVDILGSRVNVVPKVPCTISGKVTRGAIRMHGEGRDIVFDMPIRADVTARDIGGIIKEERATGSATVQARIRLDLASDWSPHGTVRLSYNWRQRPGIDILGQRITFTDQADKKLQPIVRRLEASLPRRLARVGLREQVDKLWRAGFTAIRLKSDNPEAWLRVTPQRPIFDGYQLAGNRIRLNLGMEAVTETFVGVRPRPAAPVALPPPARSGGASGLNFFVPVVADYSQVEPLIAKALQKRARRPFDVPKIGEVEASFGEVTAYATKGGRIAVGFDVTAKPLSAPLGEVKGRVWLEATPVNEEGSVEITFDDLAVTGDIEGVAGDLLVRLANSSAVIEAIEKAVSQNFVEDRDELVAKIRKALAEIRKGEFVIRSELSEFKTGKLQAFGKGLYLPVRASGDARITFTPR